MVGDFWVIRRWLIEFGRLCWVVGYWVLVLCEGEGRLGFGWVEGGGDGGV